ncbi:MAG: hypothetical protein L3J36_04290 [Rhodobacteraceae bacterium]|nr:hypothetical protein [Paracoccaceae bacterium]
MPKLVRLYIRHVLIGFAIAAAFVAMLLWFNVMNLWHLISTSDVGVLALIILWFAHGIVFAGVQFGLAVMSMAEPPKGGSGGKRQQAVRGEAQAIRVPVRQDSDPRS